MNPQTKLTNYNLAIAQICLWDLKKSNVKEAWDWRNNPELFGVSANIPYDQIKTEGDLFEDVDFWSASYWPIALIRFLLQFVVLPTKSTTLVLVR